MEPIMAAKCIQNVTTKQVRRVSYEEAKRLTDTKQWSYCSKDTWRAAGKPRD